MGPSLLAHILVECGNEQGRRGLILAGHTSAAGTNTLNDELADARARCVWALLVGDAGGFESALEEFWVIEDAYMMLRYCARLHGWTCDPGETRSQSTASYRDAVRCFQSSYNDTFEESIDVDGEVGPQTRGAFFEIYQSVLAAALGGQAALDEHRARFRVHGTVPTMSCGERYLASSRRPGEGHDDRRVEALLFLPEEPVPADASAIYEHDTFRFMEWSFAREPEPGSGNTTETVDIVEPSPEPTDGDELGVYEPHDADDPWDFLNAFNTATNQPGLRHE